MAVGAAARAGRHARARDGGRRPAGRPAGRARLPAARADGPRDHHRRARADRRRPHRRGGGGVRRASGRARRGARGADLGDHLGAARALARHRRGEPARRQPQAGARAARSGGDGAGRHGARAGGRRRRRSSVVLCPGPPRELQPMWAVALETEPVREVLLACGHVGAADHAPDRAPGVGARAGRCATSRRAACARPPGDHDLPAARRARDRDRVPAGGRRRVRAVRVGRAGTPRRAGVLPRRGDDRRDRRGPAARPAG